MPPRSTRPSEPSNYRRLEGSELKPRPPIELLGPADPADRLKVTIVVRRRADGPAVPDYAHYAKTPPSQRRRLPEEEFARKYGATADDLAAVRRFAETHGLEILDSNAARRSIVASGTVAQFNETFAVTLNTYQHQVRRSPLDTEPLTETFRGYDGFVSVPEDLADVIVGVFGLDNRRITKRAAGDPPGTGLLTVDQVRTLYDFPANQAAGQTIAIFSEGGYLPSDISANFAGSPPAVIDVPVDAPNGGFPDGETTQDICIAGAAAPGAEIAVYFTTYDQAGWVDLITRVVHPSPGDPVCAVLSSSFFVSRGDDAATLAADGIPSTWLTAVTQAFEDAAIQGVTVCIASGDFGSGDAVGDGLAHVQYPASDPWVLAVGGTTIGNVSGTNFDEYSWNDVFSIGGFSAQTATGGGVSDLFPPPWYQADAGVPPSVNDGHLGRGVPDVAGNASVNSGYPIILGGSPSLFPMNGTSSSTPLWAGLIAVINAALGENVGFVNPALYALGSSVFRDIVAEPGVTDNSLGAPGYPVGPGWDACTGWGSPKGVTLLAGLRRFYGPVIAVNLQDDLGFGTVCRGQEFRTLQVFNVGTRDLMMLSIGRVSGSSDFTLLPAPALPLAVAPGDQVDFTIRYQPTTHGVPEYATFRITSNDPVTPQLDVVASGAGGTGALETVIAAFGQFGNCCAGSFADQGLTLHNNGPCRLAIEAISSSSPEFTAPTVTSYPLILAAGGSVTVPIRFQPATPGPESAVITITSDDPAGAKAVSVSGNAPAGQLAVAGSTFFGGVHAGCHEERTIAICNVGDCQLHVTGVAFRHDNPHWKLINNPFPATLQPGSCLSVVVRYHATEKFPRSCDLVITSDDPATPVKILEVVAYTVWDECCKAGGDGKCYCTECDRERCESRRHRDEDHDCDEHCHH
jgi:kumamolisin